MRSLDDMSLEELQALKKQYSIPKTKFKSPQVQKEYEQVDPILRAVTESTPIPLTITSGKRSPQQNIAVGGVPRSYHQTGQALDLRKNADPAQLEAFRQAGYQVIPEADHFHIEPSKGFNREKALDSLSLEALQGLKSQYGDTKPEQIKTGMDANTYGYTEELSSAHPPTLDELREQKRREIGTAATALGNVGLFGQGPKVIGKTQEVLESLGLRQPESVFLKDQPFAQREQGIRQQMGQAFKESPLAALLGGIGGAIYNPLSRLVPGGTGFLGKILSGAATGAAELPAYELGTKPERQFTADELIKLASTGGEFGGALSSIPAALGTVGPKAIEYASKVPGLLEKVPGAKWIPSLLKSGAKSSIEASAKALPEELGIGGLEQARKVVGKGLQEAHGAASEAASKAYRESNLPIFEKHGEKLVPQEVQGKLSNSIFDKYQEAASKGSDSPQAQQLGELYNQVSKKGGMTLGELEALKQQTMKSAKFMYGKFNTAVRDAIGSVGSEAEGKLYDAANAAYRESKDVLGRLEPHVTKKIGGFKRPALPEATFEGTTREFSKSPSYYAKAVSQHPELQKPLSNQIMVDISRKAGAGQDINKLMDVYGKENLRKILPRNYYNQLETLSNKFQKVLNPEARAKALSGMLLRTVHGTSKVGKAGSLLKKSFPLAFQESTGEYQ